MPEAICKYCHKDFTTFKAAEIHERKCRQSFHADKQEDFKVYQPPVFSHPTISTPTLIRCGKNFIDPMDVSRICEVKDGLYIVELKSNPNPDFKLWIRESEIEPLIRYFEVRE